MRIDEFFEKQPEPKFIDWLNSPMHESAPENFGDREADEGEARVRGAFIASVYEPYREIIETATEDFEKFLKVAGVFGNEYPIIIEYSEGYSEESYSITVDSEKTVIRSSDSEGARRAVYYLEEEMIKREGAFLPLGEIKRDAIIKRRITRGFFSPTNRAPKWGDELLDEIDYYPDGYLNRLAHNGTNGLWIYTSFPQLLSSPYVPSKDENTAKRMEKLSRVKAAQAASASAKVSAWMASPVTWISSSSRVSRSSPVSTPGTVKAVNRGSSTLSSAGSMVLTVSA